MDFLKKHLATFLISFLCLGVAGVGASVLNKTISAPVECAHYFTTVLEEGTVTCTEDGTSDQLVCSKCKVVVQNTHEVRALGHSYRNGECIRCDMKESDDLEYQLSNDGSFYTIVGPGGFRGENLHIIAKHNDLPVLGIIEECFSENASLKSLHIDFGLSKIGEGAFANCKALESVVIESGCKEIGYYAFGECSSLKSVELSSGLETIGGQAFSGTAVEEFVVPSGVKLIKIDAFTGCSKLRSISLPKSIQKIEEGFYSCDMLENVDYEGNRNEWCEVTVEAEKLLEILPQEYDPETGE